MQRLEFSGAVRPIHGSLGVKRLTISLFHASTCFEHHVFVVRRSKLYYTASGIITLKEVSGLKLLKQLKLLKYIDRST